MATNPSPLLDRAEFSSARLYDPYLVKAELLAQEMCRFLEDWNLHHPQIAGQWGLDPSAPIPLRGTEWLAVETGLSEEFIKEIRRGHVTVVELIVFDRLTAAMDCPDLIHFARVFDRRRCLADELQAAAVGAK